ncbi:EcsC family protein [Camelliibacillus cellulosilyticus]|uniref:EcsC family protein n=1 Tax=Camelliibacillus cellulosilyticus TaxID=2174486 RepID=A0ABV9GPV2_9BACL
MTNYEERAREACLRWQREMMKRSSLFGRAAKSIQTKINQKIPQKAHDIITQGIKQMVQAVLYGAKWTTKRPLIETLPFEERETRVREKINTYKKIAAAEGAGTGAGGILLGLADFPALLTIKMKFLFDAASLYGFDVKDYRERLYILYVFQVAFSSDDHRFESFQKLKNWETTVQAFPTKDALKAFDWQHFQQEYRDTIDLAKMLQLVPGIGAVVGAFANYRFLDDLGHTAMNAYRMRLFNW